ncbi:hypothetical protein D051_4483 [Vibrio parahaemolyticus VPCR-2010]|nr:hypothetical protein VPUCM_0116 [Vibrio parahaemolyticus UCM-V493]AWG85355.1 hypothetical protein Vp2S01_3019 [Vibrio parahaemolyticus]EQM42591.1 hypothetical protein D051_4483 [Vibrio parahaemolyticus VPCR-2010]ESW43020.1 hypothetical protein D022_3634 [Vibrio parahaemolyticus 12310]ETT17187.1 hypothetical protein D028_1185 [Vibrio parahaemolyticus 50]ETT19692.1 hypothetical protein D023_3185 [Vibrio parahaemolyticus 3256]ETX56193.1 hypothetical protein D020_2070 [Vibrio parahaemolyticus 
MLISGKSSIYEIFMNPALINLFDFSLIDAVFTKAKTVPKKIFH